MLTLPLKILHQERVVLVAVREGGAAVAAKARRDHDGRQGEQVPIKKGTGQALGCLGKLVLAAEKALQTRWLCRRGRD